METKYPVAVKGLPLLSQGKVRDTFEIPGHSDKLLQVATDRVSTHNIVHESIIPGKGYVLTALTIFWITKILEPAGIKTHLVAHGDAIYEYLPKDDDYPDDLARRAVVVTKLDIILVEFIYRYYQSGSLWNKFVSKGLANPYSIEFTDPQYLMKKFEEPIFTPTEKSETDDPLNTDETMQKYPEASALAEKIYILARAYAQKLGIEIADCKLEFGYDPFGKLMLGDECLTPDCSRFVPLDKIVPHKDPPWLDKEFLREEAMRIWDGGKKYPLTFSEATIKETQRRYDEIQSTLLKAA